MFDRTGPLLSVVEVPSEGPILFAHRVKAGVVEAFDFPGFVVFTGTKPDKSGRFSRIRSHGPGIETMSESKSNTRATVLAQTLGMETSGLVGSHLFLLPSHSYFMGESLDPEILGTWWNRSWEMVQQSPLPMKVLTWLVSSQWVRT